VGEQQDPSPKAVLICGLGRLGQHCAALLKELGVPVFGLDHTEPRSWDIEHVPQMLDRFVVGDCRRDSVLKQAGIGLCRAVLLTTTDDRVNVSAALAARALNPKVRLVIRSSQSNLNTLLDRRLGNLVALDASDLPATAFSLAAMGGETVGMLSLAGQHLRVAESRISATGGWAKGRKLYDLNNRWRRVLHRTQAQMRQPVDFHGWDPDAYVQPDDLLSYIEFYQFDQIAGKRTASDWQLAWNSAHERAARLWTLLTKRYRTVTAVACAVILLHLTGMTLYKLHYPDVSMLDAFNVATVLIFDGYSNMFAQLKLPFPISLWLLLFSLLLTMSGAVATGIVYAFLTARVLSARLQFRRHHGRIPEEEHVVVVGMGPLGRRVTQLLHELKRPVVGVSAEELDPGLLPDIPVITGEPRESLKKANYGTAASLVAATDDDVANLELALLTAQASADCRLVIRTDDAEFGRNVTSLSPNTLAMSVYSLSAEAFAAAALGEKVLSLLRIGTETVLAVEFTVESGDTLDGRLLWDVTCGYGLVAILYQRSLSAESEFFPNEDVRLEPGNRLVVLATMAGLQQTEHGVTAARECQVRILRAVSDPAVFEGARTISRVTGCPLATAHRLMRALPNTMEQGLFRHQAARLIRELHAAGVTAEVLEVPAPN
jgi:Trk K+ transport system NAD-binding subunit